MGTFARFKDNPFARVAVLFLFLLAIGLLTRAPAHALSQFYGLHGVLSAPLFAALATWHLDCRGRLWQLLAAVGIIAALLGMMNLVMGVTGLRPHACIRTYGEHAGIIALGCVRGRFRGSELSLYRDIGGSAGLIRFPAFNGRRDRPAFRVVLGPRSAGLLGGWVLGEEGSS